MSSVKLVNNNINILRNSSCKHVYQILQLLNKRITLIAEEPKIPSHVQIGLLLSRQNAPDTVLQSLNAKYLSNKRLIKKCQFNGGDTSMTYDEDLLYFRSSCLHVKNSVDIINEMADAIYNSHPNQPSLNKDNVLLTNVNEQYEKDFILNNVIKRNNNMTLHNYISQHLKTSRNTILSVSGIPLSQLPNLTNRIHSIFKPHLLPTLNNICTHTNYVNSPIDKRIYLSHQTHTNIKLLLPSFKWNHSLTPSLTVLSEIFGNATPFSVGGPGKGIFSRSYEHILKNNPHIISCKCMHYPNKSFGIFGLDFTIRNNELHSLLTMLNTFKGFVNTITQNELTRAKNILTRKILFNLNNNSMRLEDASRSFFYFNRIIGNAYTSMINSVSLHSISSAMTTLLHNKHNAMLFVSGNYNNINHIPSITSLINLL